MAMKTADYKAKRGDFADTANLARNRWLFGPKERTVIPCTVVESSERGRRRLSRYDYALAA